VRDGEKEACRNAGDPRSSGLAELQSELVRLFFWKSRQDHFYRFAADDLVAAHEHPVGDIFLFNRHFLAKLNIRNRLRVVVDVADRLARSADDRPAPEVLNLVAVRNLDLDGKSLLAFARCCQK
jgi:hypothetical protein